MDLLPRKQFCRRCRVQKPSQQFLRLRQNQPLLDVTNRESVVDYVRREKPKLLKTCDECSEKEKPQNTARNDRAKGIRMARRVMQNGDGNLEICDFPHVLKTLVGVGSCNSYHTSRMVSFNVSVFLVDLATLLLHNSHCAMRLLGRRTSAVEVERLAPVPA
jgi:hypothetical protein